MNLSTPEQIGNAAALHHDQILAAKIVGLGAIVFAALWMHQSWTGSDVYLRRQRNLRRKRPQYVHDPQEQQRRFVALYDQENRP